MRINEYFGENVFSKAVMKERLPRDVYKELEKSTLPSQVCQKRRRETVCFATCVCVKKHL